MANLIRQSLLACGLALAASTLCVPSAIAAEAKKPVKAKAKAKVKAKAVITDDDSIKPSTPEDEPDVTDKNSVDFNCELGNKVTVYSNDADTSHIALRWKKRLHRLARVGTTTGAQRFENPNFGLIWIGIPAKGMLLDSKLNRQLANECKNAEQEMPVIAAPAKPDLIAPLGRVVVEPAIPPAALAPQVLPGVSPAGAAPAVQAPAAPAVSPATPAPSTVEPGAPAVPATPAAPVAAPASAAPLAPPAPTGMPSLTPATSPSVTPSVRPRPPATPVVPAAEAPAAPAALPEPAAPAAPAAPAVKN